MRRPVGSYRALKSKPFTSKLALNISPGHSGQANRQLAIDIVDVPRRRQLAQPSDVRKSLLPGLFPHYNQADYSDHGTAAEKASQQEFKPASRERRTLGESKDPQCHVTWLSDLDRTGRV